MDKPKIIDVEGIGEVTFAASTRAKRIVISVRPGRGIRVAMPRRASLRAAMDFVHKKEKWIKKHLAVMESHRKAKEEAAAAFRDIDKKAAGRKIKARLAELAAERGFAYGTVTIRSQKTRWGSCSSRGNISLNVKLVMLPPELFDYVLLHELVHTRVHNHSKRFWAELDKYTGNAKALARRIVEYGMGIL